ncbi:protein giant-like [Anopheles nili]|uniref:protein giant-like n=1 Tax=Anopheles nili TaxID=185578 RepID=UPI00237A2FEC|nr:protein giant-like [Anopheles nili]
MMAQFMMDLKAEPRLSPSLYSPASPKMADQNCRPQSTDSGVLDLSKRRDSLDARKTPSPSYHCFSDVGGTPPPSNHSSPQCEPAAPGGPESTILLNYSDMVRVRRLSPTKSLLHFDELRHHTHQGHLLPTPQTFHRHGLGLAKGTHPETDILQQHLLQHQSHRTPAMSPYLLPAAAAAVALQHHHHLQQQLPQPAQQQSPICPAVAFSSSPVRHRELDVLSESGSEGTSLVSSSQRPKIKEEGTGGKPTAAGQYPMVVGRDGKLSRPFKAYPRDPLSLAAGFVASDTILDTNSAEKYNLFRKRMLEQIHAANGGQPTVSNPKMRRLAGCSSRSAASSQSAALSDASSESCDEKPPSQQAPEHSFTSNMAAKSQPKPGVGEMSQRSAIASANQHVMTPSQDATEPPSSDHADSSDVTGLSSCDSAPGASEQTSLSSLSMTVNGGGGGVKDSAYYERRKKNNAAAKKSRDRRRIKEDEIAIRAAFLERENIELKFELAAARKQLALYGVTTSVAS